MYSRSYGVLVTVELQKRCTFQVDLSSRAVLPGLDFQPCSRPCVIMTGVMAASSITPEATQMARTKLVSADTDQRGIRAELIGTVRIDVVLQT